MTDRPSACRLFLSWRNRFISEEGRDDAASEGGGSTPAKSDFRAPHHRSPYFFGQPCDPERPRRRHRGDRLACARRMLLPLPSNPYRYHEEKSQIAEELLRLAASVNGKPRRRRDVPSRIVVESQIVNGRRIQIQKRRPFAIFVGLSWLMGDSPFDETFPNNPPPHLFTPSFSQSG